MDALNDAHSPVLDARLKGLPLDPPPLCDRKPFLELLWAKAPLQEK